jgi:hypothetical protein
MDIVRQIALATADLEYRKKVLTGLPGVSAPDFTLHVIWMEEAGLIKATVSEYLGGQNPTAQVFRLTWQGCEFADAVSDDTVWSKAKEAIIKPAASFTFGILLDWLKLEIEQGLPSLRR